MKENIIVALSELKEEQGISKNVKICVERIISHIQNDAELGKDKALAEIEEMMSGNNVEQHIRTQIWNVVSMIESL